MDSAMDRRVGIIHMAVFTAQLDAATVDREAFS
jgi:hypothetical protein